jgi:hypothetical protein
LPLNSATITKGAIMQIKNKKSIWSTYPLKKEFLPVLIGISFTFSGCATTANKTPQPTQVNTKIKEPALIAGGMIGHRAPANKTPQPVEVDTKVEEPEDLAGGMPVYMPPSE